MANHKKEIKVVGVGGSVYPNVRDKIYAEAKRKDISPSAYIGLVLTEHASMLPEVGPDPRQMSLLEERRLGKRGKKDGEVRNM